MSRCCTANMGQCNLVPEYEPAQAQHTSTAAVILTGRDGKAEAASHVRGVQGGSNYRNCERLCARDPGAGQDCVFDRWQIEDQLAHRRS